MTVLAAWFVVTHLPRLQVLIAGNALLAHWQSEHIPVTGQLEKTTIKSSSTPVFTCDCQGLVLHVT
jgi:hypothetical protein